MARSASRASPRARADRASSTNATSCPSRSLLGAGDATRDGAALDGRREGDVAPAEACGAGEALLAGASVVRAETTSPPLVTAGAMRLAGAARAANAARVAS